MADTINKPKLQLRSGLSVNGDKTPSPATKLLINHGKPNFTIQRSGKGAQNGDGSPLSPLSQTQNNNNNNDNAFKNANGNSNTNGNSNGDNVNNIVIKSTKFNGVFKPANVPVVEKQPHQQTSTENEAARVVLRRTKAPEPVLREDEDDSVPEFIRRQRRIQERLAKENVLDFENRRSGYFTHVMISPTSASRTSFMETMASPAVVPSLEIPPKKEERAVAAAAEPVTLNGTSNGHAEEEEEVARAIEEVNKAVAGEDDGEKLSEVAPAGLVHATMAATTLEHVEEVATNGVDADQDAVTISHTNGSEGHNETLQHTSGALCVNGDGQEFPHSVQVVQATESTEHAEQQNGIDVAAVETSAHASGALCVNAESNDADEASAMVQHASGALCVNYESNDSSSFPDTVEVVHNAEPVAAELANGTDVSSIEATSHASGALCVNYEPKTADTDTDAELEAMSKLKFDIKGDDEQNVEVTPVLRTD